MKIQPFFDLSMKSFFTKIKKIRDLAISDLFSATYSLKPVILNPIFKLLIIAFYSQIDTQLQLIYIHFVETVVQCKSA